MHSFLVFVHIIAAVAGIGTVFIFPLIANNSKTKSEARNTLALMKKLELFPKAGSITLLVTGLILGFMNTALFTTGWYIASIVLYVAAQVIVIGMLPKIMTARLQILDRHPGEDLPKEYAEVGKKSAKLEGITHVIVFALIALMYFKPF